MEAIINEVKYTGFEKEKTINELGIDITKNFIVIEDTKYFKKGDIIELARDDNTTFPIFVRKRDNNCNAISLYSIAYYEKTIEGFNYETVYFLEPNHLNGNSRLYIGKQVKDNDISSYNGLIKYHSGSYKYVTVSADMIISKFDHRGKKINSENIKRDIRNAKYKIKNKFLSEQKKEKEKLERALSLINEKISYAEKELLNISKTSSFSPINSNSISNNLY